MTTIKDPEEDKDDPIYVVSIPDFGGTKALRLLIPFALFVVVSLQYRCPASLNDNFDSHPGSKYLQDDLIWFYADSNTDENDENKKTDNPFKLEIVRFLNSYISFSSGTVRPLDRKTACTMCVYCRVLPG